jgi:hypothetical protein
MNDTQFFNLVKEQMRERGLKSMDDFVAVFTYEQLGK